MRLFINNLQLSLCTLTVLFALSARSQSIVISELMPDNKSSLMDEDGDASDWIELHNLSDNAVSLNGWYLTDDATDLTRWSFPETTIDAKGFLLVFASDKDRSAAGTELHTNFKLSGSGEYIALVQADGNSVEDDFTFPTLEEDISYGYGFTSSSLEPVVLMDAGAPCSAQIPTEEIANWKEKGFDDSGWLNGVTGVGYDENTTYQSLIGLNVMAMVDVNQTVYMRVPFEVENAAAVSSLLLKMKYDDAFVAYINGVKVAASPNAPTTLSWNSGTTSTHDDGAAQNFEEYDISTHASLLQEGDNMLAIHGLNKGEGSSDLIFVPRLEVTLNDGDIDASSVGLLSSSTPGAANGLVQYADSVETPVPFPERGFYDAPFSVTVSNITQGAIIYYTTDGSEPTTASTEYTGPITISGTTCFRVRSFIDGWKPSYPRTDTYLFSDQIANREKTDLTYINGQKLVYGMDAGVLEASYYDASNQLVTVSDALKAIPSISVTTDHGNLYDTSYGIYVHASERWEVPASAELINPDGSKGFHINAGLRIRGGASRSSGNPKHSFRLFFRDEYGESKLKYTLFEDEGVDEFKKVDLRSAQNYSWSKDNSSQNTFLRDVFARDTTAAMGHEAYARSRYYHLYINGDYWGLFMTEERPVADFGESYLGGDSDDYDAIKVIGRSQAGQYSIEATDGTLDAYNRLYSAAMAGFIENADYFSIMGLDTNGEPDLTQEKLLDVDNMIDYLLVLYHMAASDNCITWFVGRYQKLNNMYAIYNRVNPDGFKWIHHDSEHSLDTYKALDFTGPFTNSNFSLPEYFNPMTLHEKLSENEEYRLKFADRVYKHMYNDGALVRANCEARLDDRAAQIDRAIVANAARWGSTSRDRDTWVNAVSATRAFFARAGDRCSEVIDYLDADGLIPSILPPRFDVNGGQVPSGTAISLATQEAVQIVPSSPYYDIPLAVPGIIEVEDYDLGGSGIAYSDTSTGNNGGQYRLDEDVDLQVCSEGGYSIGWGETGEWLKYTVDVTSAGDYEITLRVATPNDGTAFHIEINDIDVTGSIPVGNTGGWVSWADRTAFVGLTHGKQVVKLVIDGGGININHIEFTDQQTDLLPIETPPSEPITEKTIYYTTDGTDPRAIGGGIAGSVYRGPVAINKPTHLKARCRTADGEWSALADATYWTPEIPLAVTELMYHAPDGNAGDFIEIKNISAETVTLKGYKLDNAVTFKFKNAAQTSLAPGEYIVAVDDIDSFSSTYSIGGINIAGEFSGDFSNSGEKVDVEFRDNDLISFNYDDARNWPQAADGAGHSLVPIDAAVDDEESGSLDYGANWRASTYAGGSPGYADPDEFATVVLNEITAHTDTGDPAPFDSNDEIELFNPTASAVILNDWYLSDDLDELSKWAIPDGTTIPANGFVVFDEDDFHSDRVSGFGLDKAGEQVILSVSGHVVDAIRFKGQENGVSLGRYPDGANAWLTTLPTPAAPNEPVAIAVWIREVMYNPLQPGNDFEYILLENTGNSSATLENDTGPYRIDGGVEFDFPAGTTLPAGEHLWVLSFNPTNTSKLALFCDAYGLNSANENFVGGYSGSLSDRAERVALERPQDSDDPEKPLDISWVVVDELFYFDQSPWSSNADGSGYPLVRIGLSSWIAPSAEDVDGDLMADQWELDHFQSLDQPSADWDNDGYSNLEEYIANSNPTNAASQFSVEAYDASTLYWTAVPGRTYSVYWTDDLSKAFVRIASGLTTGSYTDGVHAGSQNSNFYCIEVELLQ